MAELAIPTNTLAEMRRDLDRLRFVKRQIKEIEKTRAERLAKAPDERPCGSACAYASGRRRVETADTLVQEVFSREMRDRRALARYAGLTGAPDEKRPKTTRARPRQSRQRPRAPRDDRTRLGSSGAPEK